MFDIVAKYQPQNSLGHASGNLDHHQEKEREYVVSTKFFHLIQTSNRPNTIYPSLEVSQPGDESEHEADAMADTIMRIPEQNFIQRKCAGCGEEKVHRKPIASFIQRKESSPGTLATDAISNQINASKGNGSSMGSDTQSFMQSRFGTDFSDVKIHIGGEAVQMNRELSARAFTVGNDIYFNEGQYNPDSGEGKHFLADELTHIVPQGEQANY